jgi:hypothetical protein
MLNIQMNQNNQNVAPEILSVIKPVGNLVISRYGNGIAVGISGSRKERVETFNRFFNHGGAAENLKCTAAREDATSYIGDGYLHDIFDDEDKGFSYFLSTESSLLKSLETEFAARFPLGACAAWKGKGGGFKESMKAAAAASFNSIRRENFMGRETPFAANCMETANDSTQGE